MKILIVGAGQMGYAAGVELLRRGGIEVYYTDNNFEKSHSIPAGSKFMYSENPCNIITDKNNKFDVIIGAASYSLNESLTAAAIESRTHFCDLGGNNTVVQKQLVMSENAEKAGVFVIPDCGLAPGLACMLAARGIEQFGGTADSVKIYVGGLPEYPVAPLNYALSWSVDGLINEYLEKSKIIRNGEIVSVYSLTELENIDIFEDGDDDLEAFHTSGGISTLTETYLGKVNNLEYKTLRYQGHCNIFLAMKQLGLLTGNNRYFTEAQLNNYLPKINSENPDLVLVKVIVQKGNDTITFELCEGYSKDQHLSAMARTTGFSVAIVAYLLGIEGVELNVLRKLGKHGGVIPGELALPLEEYIGQFKNAGVKIRTSSSLPLWGNKDIPPPLSKPISFKDYLLRLIGK